MFNTNNALTAHLISDHCVHSDEIALFKDYSYHQSKTQEENQPKSKIFIKDVTLLRKPDLAPHDIGTQNIFDLTDLTATDDFDDFLGSDDQIFDDDFDFEPDANLNNVDSFQEPVDLEDLENETENGKNSVIKSVSEEETPTSKIYVRSHESLTNQEITNELIQLPTKSSTPDCIVVSSEIISEVPTSKIFIRDLPLQDNPGQYYPPETNTPETYKFPPNVYYDNIMHSESLPLQQRCKISIKNMNALIEPTLRTSQLLMKPLINSSSMIFGQAQNLVIHMRPQQNDENPINYRELSVTPETLPSSSVCDENEKIDESEIFLNSLDMPQMESSPVLSDKVEIPESNDIPKNNILITKAEQKKDQEAEPPAPKEFPMVSIPMEFPDTSKKMKIVKIIRIKKKIPSPVLKKTCLGNNVQLVFKCSHFGCTQHFSSEKLLTYHRKCHHITENKIICPECKLEDFKSFTTLHTHLWRNHKIDMDLYACELCEFKTPILSRLKNFHEKIHSNDKNCKCECGKSFKNVKQLRNHSQIHKKKLKGKILKSSTDVTKKFQCLNCQKGFSSESGLYIHSLEHKNDEKKFNCVVCEYSTNDHNSFRRHQMIHSIKYNYKCPSCSYKSIQSNTYRKHLEKQHPELAESLLYKCQLCKFTTISKGKFDGHNMTKHKISPDIDK